MRCYSHCKKGRPRDAHGMVKVKIGSIQSNFIVAYVNWFAWVFAIGKKNQSASYLDFQWSADIKSDLFNA